MSPALPLHRRQFVLGPEPVRSRADWRAERLGSAWLSHCPSLPVGRATGADGRPWALLGVAVESAPDGRPPIEQLAATRAEGVEGTTGSWTGRWALVGDTAVHPDASALLGCHWALGGDGRTWVSSSAALLAGLPQVRSGSPSRRALTGRGMSWYPPPRTRYDGIATLLPSAWLDVEAGRPRPRRWLSGIDPHRPPDEALELVASALATTMGRLPIPRWLSLSGGYDSRTVLAVAVAAGIELEAFTRLARRVPMGDRVLPPRLAASVGVLHRLLRPSGRTAAADRAVVGQHTAGQVAEDDLQPLLLGVRHGIDGVSFAGPSFLSRGWGGLRELPPSAGVDDLAAALGEPVGSEAPEGLAEWCRWVAATPVPHLDFAARAFLEQRRAGWLAAKEQAYDLAGPTRFPLLNCERSFELLLGLPDALRRGSGAQLELIRRHAPVLLEHPFNPPDDEFGRLRTWAAKARDEPLGLPAAVVRRARRPFS